MPLTTIFAQNLVRIREEKGWDQQDLCDAVRVRFNAKGIPAAAITPENIASYEDGTVQPDIIAAVCFARALDVRPGALFGKQATEHAIEHAMPTRAAALVAA